METEAGHPSEDEGALVVRASDPEEVAGRLEALDSVGGYRLEPGPTLRIRDRYVDTADGDLGARRIALRVREVDGATLLTLKGSSRTTGHGTHQRLEIEEPWSEPALARAMEELRTMGVPLEVRAGGATPVEALESVGLRVVQDRETERTVRHVLADGPAAELAIDRVTYHLGEAAPRLLEVEVEAKRPGASGVLHDVIDALDHEWPELRRWPHSKLAIGKALERLLREGRFRGELVTGKDLDRIAVELGDA
ncbi:MAG: CYTH domain-containing protein [Actinomycetota bacterium]